MRNVTSTEMSLKETNVPSADGNVGMTAGI